MIHQMNQLHDDEIFNIMVNLEFHDLISIFRSNKYFQDFCKNDTLWKILYAKNYDEEMPSTSYYDMFKLHFEIKKLMIHFEYKCDVNFFYETKEIESSRRCGKIIPSAIGSLINLKSLKFDSYISNIRRPLSLPPEIGSLMNLENFNFIRGDITEIPKEICNLKNLKFLNLGFNRIKSLPVEIENLENLTYLDVKHNNIIEIPEEMYNLHKLKYLDISSNDVKIISPKIGNLCDLDYFNIEENQIEVLPKEIDNLENLISFRFDGNNLSNQPKVKIKWTV